ncbi:N2,N2-dimethylguanosine tRNA methyltransferase [Patellaria atrata CBS 101060]|uniref:tRNA (guanine(26)-N(2))-dimethyltransferase n=1 Tax=Patellaria atrata CBS 101060 TaxID=1346257 RepID=A0A9P4S433_9PEZI|nr:N2,N2-dimethylguanosine tRNA methyltransferase [Patellaria atrata CBS 101060]
MAVESTPATSEPPQTLAPEPPQPLTVDAHPGEGQEIYHDGQQYTTIREGFAYILVPKGAAISLDPKAKVDAASQQSVFYNPIQQFNRDLSVLAIRAFGENLVRQRTSREGKAKARRENRNRKRKLQELLGVGETNAEAGATDSKRLKEGEPSIPPTDSSTIIDISEANREIVLQCVEDDAKDSKAEEHEDISDEDLLALEKSITTKDVSVNPKETENNTSNISNGSHPTTGPKVKILDALSATGLRALRYAQELPFRTQLTANDLSPKATASIALNIKHNRLEDKITATAGNAISHMYQFIDQEAIGGPGPKYDIIDLDPYGTAVPFLDAAVQALTDDGLLCVTCTDSGVFASTGYAEKCYSQYGGLPIKGFYSHEAGLRLIIHAVATAAARHGLAIEPLLSLSIDFYIRIFIRVRKSPADVKFLAGKTMIVYSCDAGCGAWQTQYLARNVERDGKDGQKFYKHSLAQAPSAPSECEHCGFKTHLGGPMWGGPLHNPSFIERILSYLPSLDKSVYKTTERVEGMLSTALEELHIFRSNELSPTQADGISDTKTSEDKATNATPAIVPNKVTALDRHPFYFIPSNLAKIIHCESPSLPQMKGALRHAGFRAVRSHAKRGTIKTDASWSVLWHIMREWVRQKSPINEGAIKHGAAGRRIIDKMEEEDVKADVSMKDEEQSNKGSDNTFSEKGNRLKKINVVFDEDMGKDREVKKLTRYQMNPRANWGPMNRAK